MTIEDIPEMWLCGKKVEGFTEGEFLLDRKNSFDLAEQPIDYQGKFVVIEDEDSSKKYVFSVYQDTSHQGLEDDFQKLVRNKFGVRETWKLRASGGGSLSIDSSQILVYDRSTKFGKYDEQVVRPIVERWAKQHLPSHKLSFS